MLKGEQDPGGQNACSLEFAKMEVFTFWKGLPQWLSIENRPTMQELQET